ncbi:MAG: hypothetical protein IJP68_10305, partial [Selenomonadaceae bacterium]|nr:hypothetical protein [Selenomonadaceae bacterium]
MDGKIFERQITPNPISKFVFDLQRFADDTVVVENFEGLKNAIANTANAGKTIQLKSGGTFTG